MVAIKVAADGRLLPAQFPFGDNPEEAIHVESLPEGNVLDYKYINGEFVYDPLPIPEPEPEPEPEPTQLDRIEAQAIYTAMMTDTLLEE